MNRCVCGREVRPFDAYPPGRSWLGCVGCKQAPEDCKCQMARDLEYIPCSADLHWVEATKEVCQPWAKALESIGWGDPLAAIVCFASAVRLEERRRLALLSPEELQEQFAHDRALSAHRKEGR